MVICNREEELLRDRSDNIWAMYMDKAYGLQYSYNSDLDLSYLWAMLAENNLAKINDRYQQQWAFDYQGTIEILEYPTQSTNEINYP